MTTEPSPAYVERELQLADEALDDAAFLLEDNRLKAAVNRAYYAMFHVVMAALAGVSPRVPKTHRGTISLFGKYYVHTGKLNIQFAQDLRNAYNLRQQSDYGTFAELGEEQVREAVEKSEAFVAEIKRLFESG